ncbi:MAG: hypothetical protein KF857_10385 [Fimbriimonadaceae bacterium]|nr:hypothetical protein [Fimbriimonadaceae bacterium]
MVLNPFNAMAAVAGLFLLLWVYRLVKEGAKALPMTVAFVAMTLLLLTLGQDGPVWARWALGVPLVLCLGWDAASRRKKP